MGYRYRQIVFLNGWKSLCGGSDVRKFSLILGGGGGLFCHKNQSCSKLSEMDRSDVKNCPSSWEKGGGLFCHKNQSCLKLPETEVKKNFPHPGEGGLFCRKKTKVAQNCLKWIDLMSKNFSLILVGGGGLFCHKNQSC